MTEKASIDEVVSVVKEVMTRAGCPSLVTVDESGLPSSRPVQAFPSDDGGCLTRIAVATHPDSRKTRHVRNNPAVLLTYVDAPSRGYVTIAGKAALVDSLEERRAAWKEPFSAFWPDGPESDSFLVIHVTPERIEARSFTQGVAAEPTRWSPVVLERADGGGWQFS